MNGIEQILGYFPDLTVEQQQQFAALDGLYREWNARINVISRKDIDNLYTHHVLHSLGIAAAVKFVPGTRLLDIGTGGGFPGIPLAILFPQCHFKLIDSIGKKTRVAQAVTQAIGLQNVEVEHRNALEEKGKYDFVVSRAVMNLSELFRLVRKNVRPGGSNALPNGLICLKGGDLGEELSPLRKTAVAWPLSGYFQEEFFETKSAVYVPCR